MDKQQKQEEYHKLLRQLVNLQQKLLQVFETEIEVVPPPGLLEKLAGGKLKDIIIPKYSVTEILGAWPEKIPVLPLVTWIVPRVGVVELEDQNWFFNVHGCLEIQFVWLSPQLDQMVLSTLKAGRMDVLKNLPEYGPEVEATYFGRGRTDGISAYSVHIFAASTGSIFGHLSEEEHKSLLEEMVEQGIIEHLPENSYNFVFVTGNTLTIRY